MACTGLLVSYQLPVTWCLSGYGSLTCANSTRSPLVCAARKQEQSVSSKGSSGKATKVAERSRGAGGGGPQSSNSKKIEPVDYSFELEESVVSGIPLPKPPAGFLMDDRGRLVRVAPAANRIVTIVDPASRRPLECMVRRAFKSLRGDDCLLLLPLDMPLRILRIEEESEGLRELTDEELQTVLPMATYALAKRRLHLIVSGFCLTARGGFCYTEDHVFDVKIDNGGGLGDSLNEGVEVANFQLNDHEYLIYIPFDPLMFVARKDALSGELQIVDDELLDDEEVLEAIDEENEFQALVDEEDAINETLRKAK